MSYTRPGRLYRTLDRLGIPTPLLTITGETFSVTDDRITSVSISNGGTDPSPGVQPSTAEALIQRPSWVKTGEHFAVALTPEAAQGIAARTGIPSASFLERFTGRIGRQTNTDTPRGLTARMFAASWSAQLSRVNVEYWLAEGMPINTAIRHLCTTAAIPGLVPISYGDFDVLAETIPDATYQTTINSLTADIGVQMRENRAGGLHVWSLPYARQWAIDRIPEQYPLTRSQALTPATWDQPNADMPAKIRAEWIASNGQTVARSAGGTTDSIIERHDWTHVKDQTGALEMRWRAITAQQWSGLFRLPTITVDVLMLLASDKPYHRGQAGMLLSRNAGDAIGLSGDWYQGLQGLHVITGIDETITKDEWTLTLSLIPYRLVYGDDSPGIPAIVWESAVYPWNTETRRWNH